MGILKGKFIVGSVGPVNFRMVIKYTTYPDPLQMEIMKNVYN